MDIGLPQAKIIDSFQIIQHLIIEKRE